MSKSFGSFVPVDDRRTVNKVLDSEGLNGVRSFSVDRSYHKTDMIRGNIDKSFHEVDFSVDSFGIDSKSQLLGEVRIDVR